MADSLYRSGMAGKSSDEAYQVDCDLCRYDHVVTEGVGFCQSCQEYLCVACLRVHQRSRATKSHVVLQGDDLPKAKKNSSLFLGFEVCGQHKDRTVEFYCTNHDEVFCRECRNIQHRRCSIQDISSSSVGKVTSQDIASLVNSTDLLVTKLQAVRDERSTDLNTLLAQREACLEELNTFRSRVNNALDLLEQAFLQQLEETVKKESKVVNDHVTSLETAMQSLETDMKNLEAARQSGDSGKVFVAMKNFSTEVMTKALNDINDEKYQVDMRFAEESVLSDVLGNLQTLGMLHVETSKTGGSHAMIPRGNNCVPAGNKSRKISKQYEVNARASCDTSECFIKGLAFLPNDKLLFVDYFNNNLKLTDVNLKLESSISIRDPWDVALLSPKEGVVTSVGPKKLQFVILEPSLQLGRTIDVKKKCYGVAVCRDTILVSCYYDPGTGEVLVMDLEGAVQRRMGVRRDGSYIFTRPYHIAVNRTGDKLYVSDYGHNKPTVTCLRLDDGTIVYTYSGQQVKYPRSLLVDEDDSVYVCDGSLRHVQVITKNGQKYRTLLTRADGLKEEPRTLAYRKRDNTLVVGGVKSDVLQIYKFL